MRLSGIGLEQNLLDEDPAGGYDELLRKVAVAVVEREMTVPAIVLLESVKPLSFLGNQMLVFLNPVVSLVVTSKDYYRFVKMIEERENIEKLILAIEEENARRSAARKAERQLRPRGRRFLGLFGRQDGDRISKGDGIGRN